MKKLVLLLAVLFCALFCLVACGEPQTTTESTVATTTTAPVTTADPDYVDGMLRVIQEGETNYIITYNESQVNKSDTVEKAVLSLRNAIRAYGASSVKLKSDFISYDEADTYEYPTYEILVGKTNRPESQAVSDLGFNQAVIRVVGKKIVITGGNETMIAQAVQKFIDTYLPEGGNTLLLDTALDLPFEMDMSFSVETGKSYLEMANEVYDAFNKKFWLGSRPDKNWFWDMAEMLETYIDAYEATGDSAHKQKAVRFANTFRSEWGTDWTWNEYNDDIMWACIAYCRLYKLTGTQAYLTIAKSNFDKTYAEAWTDDLNGGMFWRKDNQTKNSCVNCPAAIAASLLGEITGEESYWEKAKGLIQWELDNMFETRTGKVYDAYNLNGNKSEWASTYNQGTFIGACTFLYKHYNDENYLTYASKAAEYAMTKLTTNGVLDNNEDSGNDLPGFKGILTRWLYRFAKETDDLEILVFLQQNAVVAYQNQNEAGLIWTNWHEEAPDSTDGKITFGWSTAVSLMYNCLPWTVSE